MIEDIIIADDDKEEVFIFTLALNDISIKVKIRHAQDGKTLFDMLRQQIPDILFLDIMMPCTDGISCIREIRQDSRYDEMPVIMLTAARQGSYIETTYRLGANLFIRKADSIADLAEKIKKVFSIDWKSQMVYPPLANFVL